MLMRGELGVMTTLEASTELISSPAPGDMGIRERVPECVSERVLDKGDAGYCTPEMTTE